MLDAGTVEFFGDATNEGYKFHKTLDPNKYIQIVSTNANPYLPETYEEEQTRNKSKAYIQQFFKGSFNFSSNLVFPNVGTCIVAPHPLPREFNEEGRRVLFYMIGVDYGINDPTHAMFAAFSTETHKLYVFAEYRINDTDVKTIAKGYRKEIRINGTNLDGLLMLPRFDGRSYNKRESDLKTIGSMFEAEGLYFEPSFAGNEIRIIKMNALINHGQIEIYSTCEFYIEEVLNYKFKLTKDGAVTNEPKDGNDHGVTALGFVVAELPHNLQELRLSSYIPAGTEFQHDRKKITEKRMVAYDPLSEENNGRDPFAFTHNLTVPDAGSRRVGFDLVETGSAVEGDPADSDVDTTPRALEAYVPGQY